MSGEIQPKRPIFHLSTPPRPLFLSLYTPQCPILSPSRTFSSSRPSNYPPRHPHALTNTKKARAATTATLASNIFRPFQPLTSTKFNSPPFNLRPKLNASVNNPQPKFNPLQPFAHFVFSTLALTFTPNSFIYRHFIVFRLSPSLYISFSCPYIINKLY